MLRYPGPRDYCGFEAPALEPVEEPTTGGSVGPAAYPSRPASGRRSIGVPTPVSRVRRPAVEGGRPGRRRPEDRGDRVEPDSADRCNGADRAGLGPSVAAQGCRRCPGTRSWRSSAGAGWASSTRRAQLRLNRLVALKMILAGEHAGPDAVERFLAEAEIVARLQHPNIVQIYAIGDCDGRPYVALEYVEGGSLGGAPRRDALAAPRGGPADREPGLGHGRGPPDGDRPPRPEAGQHPA